MFTTASMCDTKLCLPVKYGEDYESSQAMILSLKNNDGFGAV